MKQTDLIQDISWEATLFNQLTPSQLDMFIRFCNYYKYKIVEASIQEWTVRWINNKEWWMKVLDVFIKICNNEKWKFQEQIDPLTNSYKSQENKWNTWKTIVTLENLENWIVS